MTRPPYPPYGALISTQKKLVVNATLFATMFNIRNRGPAFFVGRLLSVAFGPCVCVEVGGWVVGMANVANTATGCLW